MTDNTNANSFEKQKSKNEMKLNVISFALMILFTSVAFLIVATGEIQSMFIIPVLVIMALVQVAFQFYYFMHMKDKGHGMPSALMYGGVWCALLVLAGLGVI